VVTVKEFERNSTGKLVLLQYDVLGHGRWRLLKTQNVPPTHTKCREFLQCLNNYSLVKMEPKKAEVS